METFAPPSPLPPTRWGPLLAQPTRPLAFELQDLHDWLRTEYRAPKRGTPLQPETARAAVRRVVFMAGHGLDWGRFLESPERARQEARRFIATRRPGFASRNYVQALNWVAAYAAGERGDARFELLRWPSPAKPRTQLKRYTPDEMERILAYRHPDGNELVEKRRRALVWMAWATGLRRGELGDLRVSDLDPARGAVYVRRPRKDGKRGFRVLPDDAWSPKRPLQAWLRVRPPADDWLWTTAGPGGARRIGPDALYNDDLWFMKRDLGLAFMDFRRFRHFHGKKLARAGLALHVIQEALGHANPNSTRVYIEELDEAEMAVAFTRAGVPGYRARDRTRKPDGDQSESAPPK